MVLLLPSEPVTVTPVALVAVTVKVEEPPAATVVGLAVMVTVAAMVPAPTVPQPVTSRNKEQVMAIAITDSIEQNRKMRRSRGTRTVTMGLSFLFQVSDAGSTGKLQNWEIERTQSKQHCRGRAMQDNPCSNKWTTFVAVAYLSFTLLFLESMSWQFISN
jgi:hypothetical protein